MKLLSRFPLLGLVLACCAFGQTAVSSTTLTGAMLSGDTVVSLASTTGLLARDTSVNTQLYIEHELMDVVSLSPVVIVNRGVGGSRQSPHVNGSKVWWGPPGTFWKTEPAGACIAPNVTPIIVIPTGDTWDLPGYRTAECRRLE